MEPFRVDVPDEVLNDLQLRLKLIRWVDDFANEAWQYGTNTAYLKELVAYWIDGYDWRKHCPVAFGHVGPTVYGPKSPEPEIRSEDPRTPLPGTSATPLLSPEELASGFDSPILVVVRQ